MSRRLSSRVRAGLVAALVLGVAALGALFAGDRGAAEEESPIRWEKDLAAATAKAAETGRPLLVVFR